MKIEIEGSAKEITDFVMEVRSRLFKKTVDEDMKTICEPGHRSPKGEKGTPGYL